MAEIIEEVEVYVEPDAWSQAANATNPVRKGQQSAALAALVQKYLAQGGTITQCPMGAIALQEAVPVHGNTHNLERQLSPLTKRARARDAALCAQIDEMLATNTVPRTRDEALEALQVNKEKLIRLLRRHYYKEPRLAHLMPQVTLEDRWANIPGEKEALAERIAQGIELGMGRDALCKWCGISWGSLLKFSRRYRVELPRKKPGNPNGARNRGRFCKKEEV